MPQEESVLRLGRDEALEAARLWQECGDAREFACRVRGGVMNALMDSEAQQMCGAGRNERSDGRETSRNGYRPRSLKPAVGDAVIETLRPIREEAERILADKAYLKQVYTDGAMTASSVARKTLRKVYKRVGLVEKPL